jgi:Mrp family chromosome partitioning ATPase
MFIDMPPGTGDVTLTVFQSLPIDGLVIVTSPQELVGMIVEKAVKMAGLMNIPVLAIVENMSYVECPNCGEKIYPFGASRLVELADKYKVRLAASLPIDPKLAEACDAGRIEAFSGEWLDGIVDAIAEL